MLKKFFMSAALAASVVGGIALGAGTASAGSDLTTPAGVYPSFQACMDAGDAGYPQGRWIAWRCEALGGGQHLLWVEPIR